jgi:quercetin 2,3-dioxygenase
MVSFEKPGYKVRVKTGARTANVIFATATPLNEPIVHGGPFVMTTAQQILETTHRLQRGEMGTLDPL